MHHQLGRGGLNDALAALGELLDARGLHFELVLIGGASLLLRGVITRPTKDVDVLGAREASGKIVRLEALPEALARAVADVGLTYGLAPDWLTLGPASLLDLGLPDGFDDRLEAKRSGGLVAWVAGPFDLACFKLYAAADRWPARDRHIDDLAALAPTPDELLAAARWTRTHDLSPAFAENLKAVLRFLGVEDPDARHR
jgi:hypothetical protein